MHKGGGNRRYEVFVRATPTTATMISGKAISLVLLAASYPVLKPIIQDLIFLGSFFRKQRLSTKSKKSQPCSSPIYVALGSSFAAGPGVGEFVVDSIGNAQGTLAYPNQLSKKLGLNSSEYVNAASSGELLARVDPYQTQFVKETTRLVTISAGGNDVHYTRDTIAAAFRTQLRSKVVQVLFDFLLPLKPASKRNYTGLAASFDRVIRSIRTISPQVLIVLVSYITIMPAKGSIPPLSEPATQTLRDVADQLFTTTMEAASRNNCIFVDMTTPSRDHYAGAELPWSTGFDALVPVHPNLAGHDACADDIYATLLELGHVQSK